MKGKFLKKLNFISTIDSLKQGLSFHLNSSEKHLNQNCQTLPALKDIEEKITPSLDSKARKEEQGGQIENEEHSCLSDYEEKCPPRGTDSIILYTTSLTGIRKTFEDCKAIRFLLESFGVLFRERDVSMHLEFREELWSILGVRISPPRLFIKGRYIGGAEEVVVLHEQGKLTMLLEGMPLDTSNSPCQGCANVRFFICVSCHGSRKVVVDEGSEGICIRCSECNENGLVPCTICC